jgi:hypothetical protein
MVRSLRRILGDTNSCFSLSRHRSPARRIHRRIRSWTHSPRRRQRTNRWFPRRHLRRHPNSNTIFHRTRSSRRSHSWNYRRTIWRLSWFSSRRNSDYTSYIRGYNCSYRRINRRSNQALKKEALPEATCLNFLLSIQHKRFFTRKLFRHLVQNHLFFGLLA